MNCGKKRDITEVIWSVFTSFGFAERETPTGDKYCLFDKNTAVCVNKSGTTKARADVIAAATEAALANGLENIEIVIGDEALFELLTLFGFEKMLKKESNEKGASLRSGETEFAGASFGENIAECVFNTEAFYRALENDGADMSDNDVSASLIYAEKNAEGIAYDIAYNLRVNGCIVEYYNEGGDINSAEEYADKKKMSCILRAYPDGRLMMKDTVKNEITETTAQDFLGCYNEEDECGCGDEDCGHEHHHHDCDCGCH